MHERGKEHQKKVANIWVLKKQRFTKYSYIFYNGVDENQEKESSFPHKRFTIDVLPTFLQFSNTYMQQNKICRIW